MLLKREIDILENDNFEDIHDRLGAVGAETLLDTVRALCEGTLCMEAMLRTKVREDS